MFGKNTPKKRSAGISNLRTTTPKPQLSGKGDRELFERLGENEKKSHKKSEK